MGGSGLYAVVVIIWEAFCMMVVDVTQRVHVAMV